MALRGERVSLRPLTRADLDQIEAWTPHTDPLYVAWNRFPWHRLGKDLWHELEAADPAIERYAILDLQGRVIGVLGLVDADGTGSPLLSIFLGADFVGQGLGSDVLCTWLDYAFRERGLESLHLEVAASNERARRVYEKCGFRVKGSFHRLAEEGQSLAFLADARFRHLRPYFRQEGGKTRVLFYRMEIRASDWQAPRGERNVPRSHT